MDPERPFGHLRGDGGIAVAVAADPRAPSGGTAGTAAVACPSGRRRPPRRAGAAGRGPPVVQRGIGRPVEPRHRAEQRLVEERERGPDLVERGHGAIARRSAVRHRSVISSRSRRRRSRSSAAAMSRSASRSRRRSTRRRARSSVRRRASVGWAVRTGVIRRRPSAAVDAASSRRTGAAIDAVASDRRERAAARSRAARSRRRAVRTPLALLGEVDEPEVQAERADHDLGPLGVERRRARGERRPARRVVAAPEADRRSADALDEVEELAAGLLGDDLAEQRAEQADLERQRVARPAGADSSRAPRGRPTFGRRPAGGREVTPPLPTLARSTHRSAAARGASPQPSRLASLRTLVS